jgi:hypothetical protein
MAGVIAAAQWIAPVPCFAQVPAGPPKTLSVSDAKQQAAEHFGRAVRMYQEDDFRGALIEFNRAYELAPHWGVLYNIGQTQYQLRDYAAALKAMERYVDEGGADVPADRRAQVDRELAELRGRVAHVALASNVDAEVAVDDVTLGRVAALQPVLVGAGRHKFSASKPGFVASSKVVDIAGGDTVTIRLALEPEPAASPAAPREAPSYAAAILAGSVGVAGVAVGTIFGVLTVDGKSTLDRECGGTKACPSSAQTDIDAYSRNGTISGVAFGVGAAGLLVGGYLFFRERGRQAGPESTQAHVAPWFGPTGAGVSGSF